MADCIVAKLHSVEVVGKNDMIIFFFECFFKKVKIIKGHNSTSIYTEIALITVSIWK